jgi:hypothetical protein
MNTDYSDIRSRIPEPPNWFDEHAVPRYCPFAPSEASDIYAKEVVLLLVECQACEHEFRVCLSWSAMDGVRDIPPLSANPAGLEYHDPPNVECCAAGPTMNSVPIRVLEFWRKERFDWERVPAFEVESACRWADA